MVIFRGYASDLLPWIEIPSVEDSWKLASEHLLKRKSRGFKSTFEKRDGLYLDALTSLGERYDFFMSVLRNEPGVVIGPEDAPTDYEPGVMEKYGGEMGEDQLFERVVFAMHHVFDKGEKISESRAKLITGFPSYVLRKSNEAWPDTGVSMPPSRCESVGFCLDSTPPYMEGCMGDASGLARTQEAYDKNMEGIMKDAVKTLSF